MQDGGTVNCSLRVCKVAFYRFPRIRMPLTYEQVLLFLYMLVAVMLIVVLYHIIFIVVDLRKIAHRVEEVTQEAQTLIMKPISVADQVMDVVMDFLTQKSKADKKHVDTKKHG